MEKIPAASHYFVLDTSAVIGYFETLRPHTASPTATDARVDFAAYHHRLLHRWEAMTEHSTDGLMPVRIPDYVVYELSGLMPPMLQFARERIAAIDAQYHTAIARAEGTQRAALQREKAHAYQVEIDHLVDWSIRLDRRRPLDNKSSIGDRVEELTQLFTLLVYHPEVVVPTQVGMEFVQSARAESAVVAGVGNTGRPITPQTYREEILAIAPTLTGEATEPRAKPALANYSLSFNDLWRTPELTFAIDDLRIHWGQMYFMGLIGEDQYRNFMRHMSGAEAANEQGYDSNKRFVTYGSLMHRTRETGLTHSGLVQRVHDAKAAMIEAGAKPEFVHRRNLTFDELQRFVPTPEFDMRHAIGPAKITMDQCIFGGVLPGAAIKRHRQGDDHVVKQNDADVEALRVMAQALGYTPPGIIPGAKDRYQALRNSLKHQGFFERYVTIEDCLRMQHACVEASIACPTLDRLVEHLPMVLDEKHTTLSKNLPDGTVSLSAPLERIFTHGLVHGILSPAQFVALLVKLDPTALNGDHFPELRIAAGDRQLCFRVASDQAPQRLSANALAAAIIPESLVLELDGASATHFDRLQNFCDLVAVGRRARRSGANFGEGQQLLDYLLAAKFRASELAPKQRLQKAHDIFIDLLGAEHGDAVFFQLFKDFESRQERSFQAGDQVTSSKIPAQCAIAANHRNRLIARRNLGEVAVVEAAQTLLQQDNAARVWVIGNDQDLVSYRQYRWLDPETAPQKNMPGKPADPVTLGKRGLDAGIMLRPPIAQQHSRLMRYLPLLHAQHGAQSGEPRCYNVPTRDWLQYVGSLNGVSPTAGLSPDDFTHRYLKASGPFRDAFHQH